MVLAQRLAQRQAQGLVMTPQLQQAVALLQLSNLDLAAHLAEQASANPFLEVVPPPVRPAPAGNGGFRNRTQGGFDLAALLESPHTLLQHLERQMETDLETRRQRDLARLFLAHLDERGYLDPEWREDFSRRGIGETESLPVLARLQQMDPPGIFARDLAECLRLQLEDKDALTPQLACLLDNWQSLASGDQRALEKAGIPKDALPGLLASLKPLHPRPVDGFAHASAPLCEPDILLHGQPGAWRLELNANTLPRVLVDRDYHRDILSALRPGEDKAWVSEKIASASWLVRAMDQRAQTVLRIATHIVEAQAGFFRNGPQALRPLTLRMVADAAGVHESTVSRVAAGKTMMTPRGVFKLKYFFPAAMPADGGDGCSATAVRDVIARMVASETAGHILSDDDLVEALAARGMKAARRTVAKYRDALGIPSSYERKRLKRFSA